MRLLLQIMNQDKYFFDVYSDDDVELVPSRFREILKDCRVEGKTNRTIVLPNGRRYFLGNKLNDLTGAEWTYFTSSVFCTNFTTNGADNCAYKIRKIHPSPKPPTLLKEIIEFFTKENDLVLDYFAGVGGTLIGATLANRKAIGIELNPEYCDAYQKACEYMQIKQETLICGDSLTVLDSLEFKNICSKKVKLILIDPPYKNMMSLPKTADDIKRYGNSGTPFTSSSSDLGNMGESEFWNSFLAIVKKSLNYLDNKGHVVVFIKDLQPKGKKNNLLHAEMIEKLTENLPLEYLGMKIWADKNVSLFPYGYPFEYVSNQIHQFILVFKLSQ